VNRTFRNNIKFQSLSALYSLPRTPKTPQLFSFSLSRLLSRTHSLTQPFCLSKYTAQSEEDDLMPFVVGDLCCCGVDDAFFLLKAYMYTHTLFVVYTVIESEIEGKQSDDNNEESSYLLVMMLNAENYYM
jgi:hypothetical protein